MGWVQREGPSHYVGALARAGREGELEALPRRFGSLNMHDGRLAVARLVGEASGHARKGAPP
ncbi:MAG TPA: hypothetical protein VJM69_05510 [Dehalococcoidia bacterium]|nr:hypothetical protein [Dehalococcoidia bacterium]